MMNKRAYSFHFIFGEQTFGAHLYLPIVFAQFIVSMHLDPNHEFSFICVGLHKYVMRNCSAFVKDVRCYANKETRKYLGREKKSS